MRRGISVIEHTHATTILILLFEQGPLTVTSIMEEGNINRTTFYSTLPVLLKSGLVVEDREEFFPRRRIIKLTERGRKVAEFLIKIRDILDL
ncbi:MAG: helix-turn-helix domain-containing protein [Thermoprotei archaeon]